MTYQRDFDQKLRVGVVGLGGHAYRNVLPALHYLPVELAALCDVDAARLARTEAEYRTGAAFTDAEAMFRQANLDAVLLCTGPRSHPALAMRAFAAGLDVWME
ncbi:MAG: Gfo/Idh/MocA family oxidoreductase, partial [Thermomicrobiales bacterium]|nr:Gfo/Idh/MocA family oxidoreductase [Thermomicrobiales bacterium]